ncbi:MAG: SWF or SNF family helicase, partial [Kineosporiaceae bacterium]
EVAGAEHLLAAAREPLRQLTGTPPRLTGNRLSSAGVQLRLGRDLQWYPYLRSRGEWDPAGPPSPDPAVALEPC